MNAINSIIAEELSGVAEKHGLLMRFLDEGEALIIGSDFCLLVWCDKEGVSIDFVELGASKTSLKSLNLGHYIVTSRKWHAAPGTTEDLYSRIRQGLASWRITLEEEASDIVSGDRKWLSKVHDHFSPLSALTQERILANIHPVK